MLYSLIDERDLMPNFFRALALTLLLPLLLTTAQAQPQSSAEAGADYRRRLQAYNAAWQAYDAEATAYWALVTDKRRLRLAKRGRGEAVSLEDYVLAQPPVYAGPVCPRDPSVKQEDQPADMPELPVVADFLRNAKEHFGFEPEQVNELDFKRAYVKVAAREGITRDQVVRIYGFETGGNGKFDAQAGLIFNKPGARAISTALGYNQLLTANTTSLLAGKGSRFVKVLQERAAALSGEERKKLERKIEALKRMVAFSRTVPEQWSEHVKLARTQAEALAATRTFAAGAVNASTDLVTLAGHGFAANQAVTYRGPRKLDFYAGVVDATAETIALGTAAQPHGLVDGDQVVYRIEDVVLERPTNQPAAALGGLSANGTYFVKAVDATTVKLATSAQNLANGVFVNLSVSSAAQLTKHSLQKAAERAITAPPTTSLWPLMYLVVECSEKSAPSASGCCQAGDRKVLSTTVRAPLRRAAAVIAAMSVMRSSGLLGVSIHTSCVGLAMAAASARSSANFTKSTCSSPRRRQASNRRYVPP